MNNNSTNCCIILARTVHLPAEKSKFCHRMDERILVDQVLVEDVLKIIFELLFVQDVKHTGRFCLVSKRFGHNDSINTDRWNKVVSSSSELWKGTDDQTAKIITSEFVLSKWPYLATSNKIKNWKLVASRRFIL